MKESTNTPSFIALPYQDKLVLLLLGTWVVMQCFQSAYTGILHDEAYYWMYSRSIDWGFFDHPPMIALLIKAGYAIFPGILGVRLAVCLLVPVGFYLVWRVIRTYQGKVNVFFFLLAGAMFSHIFSWVSTPDSPLLLFVCIYFFLLHRYIQRDDNKTTILLLICIAAMLYTKYHAVLILFFTLLAWPAIFRRRSLYIIAIGVFICFLPHLYWQYLHDWPSFEYHLSGRNRKTYGIHFTYYYILNQFLVFGPLIGLPVFWLLRLLPKGDPFLRILYFTFWGFLLFFLLNSFRGWVEPHWTSPVFPCFLILGTIVISQKNEKWLAWIKGLSIVTLLLLIPVRLLLTMEDTIHQLGHRTEMHNWEDWAMQIQEFAGDKPVVFFNSFQRPSKYTWYTGQLSTSLNNYEYRRNQYDLWDFEDRMQHQAVVVVERNTIEGATDSILPANFEKTYLTDVLNFQSFYNIQIELEDCCDTFTMTQEHAISARITNHRMLPLVLEHPDYEPVFLTYTLMDGKRVIHSKELRDIWPIDHLPAGDAFTLKIPVSFPVEAGDYDLIISMDTGYLRPAMNSGKIKIHLIDSD